ncbi:hypothetical protein L6452_34912 [Arctium lappa]|uniref:Uncharacterized protein n=1 Tax=Arctium lappa TaxID=4217 RepID=A0ACB8YIV1_ARCLA|nr:hypothetical protein L6452_34912 [Arctium lappa]
MWNCIDGFVIDEIDIDGIGNDGIGSEGIGNDESDSKGIGSDENVVMTVDGYYMVFDGGLGTVNCEMR